MVDSSNNTNNNYQTIVRRTEHYTVYTCKFSICLTNVRYSKNCLVWERTNKATFITEKQNVHNIKKRTYFIVQHNLYFF